jgi:uncharacterized protein YodC (DUF2158 family)
MAKSVYKQFRAGEVVVLASGGFPMTVSRGTNHEGTVECVWFNFNGLCESTFPAEGLSVTKLRLDASCNTIE